LDKPEQQLPINTVLGKLRILEILDRDGGPRLRIAENASGSRYLAFEVEVMEQGSRWLYAPISDTRIDHLMAGKLPLRRIYSDPEDGFIFGVCVSPQSSSVDVMTADAVESDWLPLNDDVGFAQAEGFTANGGGSPSHAGPCIHRITIHRPRSSKAIAFTALTAVAAHWAKFVHAGLEATPCLLDASANPLVFELQTPAEAQLLPGLQCLQGLIASPTPEQIESQLSPQACKRLEQLLSTLYDDKLTLSIQLMEPEPLSLVLSHARTQALRAALLGVNQQRIGATEVPQADDLDKLFRMLELMQSGETNLGYRLDLSPRHMNYYKQAARILDLLNDNDGITGRGYYLVSLSQVVERYEIAMMLFESSPVGFAWLRSSEVQTAVDLNPDSALTFLNAHSSNLSAATVSRRAQTLRYWVQTFQTKLA
jgi:hypothetical protein